MNNIRYTIHRYEPHGNPPDGKIVGFLIKNYDTNRSEYIEVFLTSEECSEKTDDGICILAYNKCKNSIEKIINLLNSHPIIGSEFIP